MKWLLIIIFMYNCFAQEMREVEVPSDGPRRFVAQINDYCTATFISPTMLITAQHCVDDIQNNSLPSKDYLVYRARTSEDVFENVYSITSVKQLSSKRDIALVTVEPPLNTEGEAFPSVKCTDITTLIGNGTQAQLTGYPGDTGSKLREANCYVGRAVYLQDDYIIKYGCKTQGGVSGSSVRYKDDPMTIFGIHSAGTRYNDQVKINNGLLFKESECKEIQKSLIDETTHFLTRNLSVEETLLRSGECSTDTLPYEEFVLDHD